MATFGMKKSLPTCPNRVSRSCPKPDTNYDTNTEKC